MKKLFIFFLFVLCCSLAFSQTFIREIVLDSSTSSAGFAKGIDYPNGNVLFAAALNSSFPYSTIFIMLNASGDTVWTREIDSIWIINIYQKGMLAPTFDGGCVMLGWDWSDDYFHLTRLDSMGNHLWTKDYQVQSNTDVDTLIGVVQTKDSGFAFMGRTTIPWGNSGFSFVKVNGAGDTLWTRKYISLDDEIYDFAEASDSGFYFVGSNGYSGTLTKTDKDGGVLWRHKYTLPVGGVSFLEIRSVRNDTLLIETTQYSSANKDGLVEISGSGLFLNSTLFDSTYYSFSSFLCRDGRILVAQGPNVVALDQQMNFLWKRFYNVNFWMPGFLMFVTEKANGNYWVLGNCGDGIYDQICLYNTDSQGYAPCNTYTSSTLMTPRTMIIDTLSGWQELKYPFAITSRTLVHSSSATITELCNVSSNENKSIENQLLFPNPSHDQFTIHDSRFTIEEVEMYNLLGEIVFEKQFLDNTSEATAGVENFNPGIYFVKIHTEKGTSVQKFIKQ